MNPIFKFHFDYMFRKALPTKNIWLWPTAFTLGLVIVSLLHPGRGTWLDAVTRVQFLGMLVTLLITFPLMWAGFLGAANGLIAMWRFRGYDTIDMAPGYRAFRMTPDQRAFAQFDTDHITKDRERIIGSANIDDEGNIYTVRSPGRHHHVLWYMAKFGKNNKCRQQGFLTNRYRFLGRQDARKLAIANGQAPSPSHNRDLFSEDLWDTPEHLQFKG